MKKHFSMIRGLRSLCAALLLGAGSIAAYAAVNSGNASLSALEIKVSGRNIATGFSSDNTNLAIDYDGVLPTYASFSAAPVASDGVVTISLNGTELTNHSMGQLVDGSTVKFNVKSGNALKVYTVTVKTPTPPQPDHRTIHFKGGWSTPPMSTYIQPQRQAPPSTQANGPEKR